MQEVVSHEGIEIRREARPDLDQHPLFCKIDHPNLAIFTISKSQIEPLVNCAKNSRPQPILQFLPINRRLGTVSMKSAEQAQPEQFT